MTEAADDPPNPHLVRRGVLSMDGTPVGAPLGSYYLRLEVEAERADGLIMIVVATDAPLSDRNLERLAAR